MGSGKCENPFDAEKCRKCGSQGIDRFARQRTLLMSRGALESHLKRPRMFKAVGGGVARNLYI